MHRRSDAAVGSAEHPVRLLNETNHIELDHLSRNMIAVVKLSNLLMYQLASFLSPGRAALHPMISMTSPTI